MASKATVSDLESFTIGTSIGRHLIISLVGQGGMGKVYQAYDPILDRKVAIKFIREHLVGKIDKNIFLREAQAMAKISHPNVVSIYEVGTINEQIYLVLDLLEGEELNDWLVRDRRSWRDVVSVLGDVAKGLAEIHRSGMIHRDFKPSNVFVTKENKGIILDFGLAKADQDKNPEFYSSETSYPSKENSEETDSKDVLYRVYTKAGKLVGTLAYMAPEQRKGKADARSDQYAFFLTFLLFLNHSPILSSLLFLQSHVLRNKALLKQLIQIYH